MSNNIPKWYLFIELEDGVPVGLRSMSDRCPSIIGSTRFIGPLGHLKNNSNENTWYNLINSLNKGFLNCRDDGFKPSFLSGDL